MKDRELMIDMKQLSTRLEEGIRGIIDISLLTDRDTKRLTPEVKKYLKVSDKDEDALLKRVNTIENSLIRCVTGVAMLKGLVSKELTPQAFISMIETS